MIRDELDAIWAWEERHQRLVARLAIAAMLTAFVDLVCTILMWRFEHGRDGSDIHSLGDALFFTTVQLLTVSSQMTNPVTSAGRFVDVLLEIWALFVVTAIAGSFAAFFGSRD